jgi:hypothetical protein
MNGLDPDPTTAYEEYERRASGVVPGEGFKYGLWLAVGLLLFVGGAAGFLVSLFL